MAASDIAGCIEVPSVASARRDFKRTTRIAEEVKRAGIKKSDGFRDCFWKHGQQNQEKGIMVIEFGGRNQSITPMNRKDWERRIRTKGLK